MTATMAEKPEPVVRKEELTCKETDSHGDVLVRLRASEKDLQAQFDVFEFDRLDKNIAAVPGMSALGSY